MNQREHLQKLIDALPDASIDDAIKTIESVHEHGVFIPYHGGIPVFDMANKEHMRIVAGFGNKSKGDIKHG